VEGSRIARHENEDAELAEITDQMTYGSVSRALRNAETSGVISRTFRVRASAELAGMRLVLKNLNLMDRVVDGTPFISLTPWFPDTRGAQTASWNDGEDVVDVMQKIIRQLEAANTDASVATFNPELVFLNLRRSLSVALLSRRSETPSRLRGPLIELFDDHWAFTDAGLESQIDEVFVPANVFPATIARFRNPGTPPFVPPDAPAGVTKETWHLLMQIAGPTYLGHSNRLAGRKGLVV
jgi:hypothetical protein